MYKWLATQMNLDEDATHVKYFTRQQCKNAIKILRPKYIQIFGQDLKWDANSYKKKGTKNMEENKELHNIVPAQIQENLTLTKLAKEELIKVTRHEEFETAHLLPNYDGPCGNLHGHSYKIELTLEGPQMPGYYGMVMDFKQMKQMIKDIVPDHQFVLWKDDTISLEIVEVLKKYGMKYMIFEHPTTAENMVKDFAEMFESYIHNELKLPNVHVYEVNLWETTNSHATWKRGE